MPKKRLMSFVCVYLALSAYFYMQKSVHVEAESTVDAIIKAEKIKNPDKRAELRAFYSAPPVIPHEVTVKTSQECLTCHLNVRTLDDGRITVKTPHPQLTSCLQCHIPSLTSGSVEEVESEWQGLEEPKRGDRWSRMSPPTIPHRVRLRENCLSCHGPDNPDMRLRTTHPERTSCLQCHVPNMDNEF